MKSLTKKHKILIGLLSFAVLYLIYSYVQFRQELFAVYDMPVKYTYATSADADLVIIDFNKYGCNHCRTLHPILLEAMERDGNVIYIPRPVTFGDKLAGTVSYAVYAAAEQGKFIEMFNAVYDNWPIRDPQQLFKVAGKIGLDTEKLSRDMKDPEITYWLQSNDDFFLAWGLRSTPVLLVGKSQMMQYGETPPTVPELLDKFAEARASWL